MSSTKQSKFLALIDCDSFYCSCERVFNPKARKAPVVVLSNNDGCVVSRSSEAKAIGIPMCAPYYQIKHLVKEKGLMAFSSNYALYGDLSKRVMQTLSEFTPELEVYSIDEAFLDITNIPIRNYELFGRKIKETIYNEIGIPVSVGIAPTKVLTKVAGKFAKKNGKGIFIVDKNDDRSELLRKLPCEDIWGIGRASDLKLKLHGINTAWELVNTDEKLIQKVLSITGKKIVLELQGESVLDFEIEREKKMQMMSSKSFEKTVFDLATIKEAVSSHALRITEKLRGSDQLAYGISVFIQTHPMKDVPQYYNSDLKTLPHGTDDYMEILKYVLEGVEKIYRPGFEYRKCGVCLIDLREKSEAQLGLFDEQIGSSKISKLMDDINGKFGARTLSVLSCGKTSPWETGSHLKSGAFTTSWEELVRVG